MKENKKIFYKKAWLKTKILLLLLFFISLVYTIIVGIWFKNTNNNIIINFFTATFIYSIFSFIFYVIFLVSVAIPREFKKFKDERLNSSPAYWIRKVKIEDVVSKLDKLFYEQDFNNNYDISHKISFIKLVLKSKLTSTEMNNYYILLSSSGYNHVFINFVLTVLITTLSILGYERIMNILQFIIKSILSNGDMNQSIFFILYTIILILGIFLMVSWKDESNKKILFYKMVLKDIIEENK
ncbi:hypothetical protein [Companilactobacillus sp. DQM5]|uniref:hypothetical protein n=1 Tax=Companilactobacillus sp. DQM5 TaxID=3463359 RepID=UPI004059A5F6